MSMKDKLYPDVRLLCAFALFVTFLTCVPSRAADGTPPPPKAWVLTTTGVLLEGTFERFEDGFLFLGQDERILTISPAHIIGIFFNRNDAERTLKRFLHHRNNPAQGNSSEEG